MKIWSPQTLPLVIHSTTHFLCGWSPHNIRVERIKGHCGKSTSTTLDDILLRMNIAAQWLSKVHSACPYIYDHCQKHQRSRGHNCFLIPWCGQSPERQLPVANLHSASLVLAQQKVKPCTDCFYQHAASFVLLGHHDVFSTLEPSCTNAISIYRNLYYELLKSVQFNELSVLWLYECQTMLCWRVVKIKIGNHQM